MRRPDLAPLGPHIGDAVHRLHRRVGEERRLVGRHQGLRRRAERVGVDVAQGHDVLAGDAAQLGRPATGVITPCAGTRALTAFIVVAEGGRFVRPAAGALVGEAFAGAVTRLLACSELRRSLGSAGRLLLEKEFTWEAAWKKLDL